MIAGMFLCTANCRCWEARCLRWVGIFLCTGQSREMCHLLGLANTACPACAVSERKQVPYGAACPCARGVWAMCPEGSSGLAYSCCTGLLQVHARRRKLDPDVDLLQIAKDLPGLSGELLQPLPALHLCALSLWHCSLHPVTL